MTAATTLDKLAVRPDDRFPPEPTVTAADAVNADKLTPLGYRPLNEAVSWPLDAGFYVGPWRFRNAGGGVWQHNPAPPRGPDPAAVVPGDRFTDDAAELAFGVNQANAAHALPGRGYHPATTAPWSHGAYAAIGIHDVYWDGTYWQPGTAP